jgi:hypothetical protein
MISMNAMVTPMAIRQLMVTWEAWMALASVIVGIYRNAAGRFRS